MNYSQHRSLSVHVQTKYSSFIKYNNSDIYYYNKEQQPPFQFYLHKKSPLLINNYQARDEIYSRYHPFSHQRCLNSTKIPGNLTVPTEYLVYNQTPLVQSSSSLIALIPTLSILGSLIISPHSYSSSHKIIIFNKNLKLFYRLSAITSIIF